MLGSYVCRQCRARLHPRRISAGAPQWQSRATFISLRNTQPRPDAEQSEDSTQLGDANTASASDQRPSYDLFERRQTNGQRPSNGSLRLGRYSRHVRDNTADAAKTRDTALPETVESVEDVGQVVKIKRRLREQGLEQAWALFQRTYSAADCEALKNPSAADIRQINEFRFFGNFLAEIIERFHQGQEQLKVTPTAALFKYEQLHIAPPGLWVKTAIEPLTHQVMLAANGSSQSPQRDLQSLLSELISVWRLFFQCKGLGNDSLELVSPKWNLPSIEAIPHQFHSADFNFRLQDFHPKCVGSSTLGFYAVYMFNLSDAINANESLRLQAAPFLDFLVRILSGSRVNAVLKHPANSQLFQSLPQDVQVEITKEIELAPSRALSALGRQQGSGSSMESNRETVKKAGQATTDLESFNLKAIARAVESRTSPVVLESHWKRIVRDYTQDGKTSIPSSV